MAAASRPMSRLVSHGCELRPNQALKLTQVTGCRLQSCGGLGSILLFPTVLLRSSLGRGSSIRLQLG